MIKLIITSRFFVPMMLILIVEAVSRAGLVSPITLLPFSTIVQRLFELITRQGFWNQVGLSLSNIAISSCTSWFLGGAFGLVIHSSARLRQAIEPFLASYYAVPLFIFGNYHLDETFARK